MSTATPAGLMTAEELLALPDNDGVNRELVLGELREYPMTVRNLVHCDTAACVTFALKLWLRDTAEAPDARVYVGEVGCILRRDPDSLVGVDVALVSTDIVTRERSSTTLIDGPPILAVEILSPSDTQESVNEKVELYLDCGVQAVWVLDPYWRTARVHGPNALLQQFSQGDELASEPALPGFRCPVARLFE